MSGYKGPRSSKDSSNHRLEVIASQIAPGNNSTDGEIQDVREKSSLSNDISDSQSHFQLEDHPIDAHRKLKASHHSISDDKSRQILDTYCIQVAPIGAGLAGINAGILLPIKVPSIELKIYEKNTDVGGTWLQNIYPGVRCAEISRYWKEVAKEHNVYQYISFSRKILGAKWDDQASQWHLTIENLVNGDVIRDKVDVLITAIGHFDAWKLPEYPEIEGYKGHLLHSSNWDPDFDPKRKTIATIGNGASGIQVTTALQKVAGNPTWIAGSFAGDVRPPESKFYTPAQLLEFRDPSKYLAFRKRLENTYWKRFNVLFKNSPESLALKEDFQKLMRKRLSLKPELAEYLIPEFSPHCRRLTPGLGYLEAITSEIVEFIPTAIKRFTEHGIETVDEKIKEADAVICATGANTNFAPPFSIISSGIDLKEAWKPSGRYGFPLPCIGVATPGFPNLFFVNGPISSGFSGTVPHSVENQVTYIARVLSKVSSQGKSIVPSEAATSEFVEYSDAFYPKTVLSKNCKSWSNGGIAGGKIHEHWPGSAAHLNQVRREPRWEDFEYKYGGPNPRNRFGYFGNGSTKKEMVEDADLTGYLKAAGEVDLRIYHETWFDV